MGAADYRCLIARRIATDAVPRRLSILKQLLQHGCTSMRRVAHILLALIAVIILTAGCRERIPEFIHEKIRSDGAAGVDAVWSFRYDGRTVYYLQSGCCDMYNHLYDSDGTHLCAPDGGITGGGDGECPDFWDDASHRKVLWERGRDSSLGNN